MVGKSIMIIELFEEIAEITEVIQQRRDRDFINLPN